MVHTSLAKFSCLECTGKTNWIPVLHQPDSVFPRASTLLCDLHTALPLPSAQCVMSTQVPVLNTRVHMTMPCPPQPGPHFSAWTLLHCCATEGTVHGGRMALANSAPPHMRRLPSVLCDFPSTGPDEGAPEVNFNGLYRVKLLQKRKWHGRC